MWSIISQPHPCRMFPVCCMICSQTLPWRRITHPLRQLGHFVVTVSRAYQCGIIPVGIKFASVFQEVYHHYTQWISKMFVSLEITATTTTSITTTTTAVTTTTTTTSSSPSPPLSSPSAPFPHSSPPPPYSSPTFPLPPYSCPYYSTSCPPHYYYYSSYWLSQIVSMTWNRMLFPCTAKCCRKQREAIICATLLLCINSRGSHLVQTA